MHRTIGRGAIVVGLPALLLASYALATSAQDAEPVTLSYYIDDNNVTADRIGGLTDAYTALNPNVTFEIETHPGGSWRAA